MTPASRILASLTLLSVLAGASPSLAQKTPARVEAPEAARAPHSNSKRQAMVAMEQRTETRALLAERRALNLARFQQYVARGVYPVNSYQPGLLNVFIDAQGHICAAATIMTDDGLGDLVRTLASEQNFLRLGDVASGPVYEWILASGFTQEEIAMIQEPFMGQGEDPSFYGPGIAPEVEPEIDPAVQAAAEHARLVEAYAAITAQLLVEERDALNTATDRFLAHHGG